MGIQNIKESPLDTIQIRSTLSQQGNPASMLSQTDLRTAQNFLVNQGVSLLGSQQFWRGQTISNSRDRTIIATLIQELEPLIARHDRPGVNSLTYKGIRLSRSVLEVGGLAAEKFLADPSRLSGAPRRF